MSFEKSLYDARAKHHDKPTKGMSAAQLHEHYKESIRLENLYLQGPSTWRMVLAEALLPFLFLVFLFCVIFAVYFMIMFAPRFFR